MDQNVDELVLNEEIKRMNEEIIELSEDNQRLNNMFVIIQQIYQLLQPFIHNCKCLSSDIQIKAKLIVLNNKYQQLRDSESNFNIIKDQNYFNNSHKIIDRINKCNQIKPKLLVKKNIFIANNEVSNQSHDESADENIDSVNDITDYVISVERFDETFDTKTGEEVEFEFVLPNIDNEVNSCDDKSVYTLKTNNSRDKSKGRKSVGKKVKNKSYFSDKSIDNKLKNKRKNKMRCTWPGCEQLFRDNFNLQVHMTRHTGERSYRCLWSGCVKTYATKAALDVHCNKHSDNRRFKCMFDDCDAAFIRKTQLTVHISNKHTGNRQYKCDWPGCEYQTCYLNRLQAHKMRHTGEKPYKCQWTDCEWSFRLRHHLKSHMLKHTGEKPFVCDLSECDKRFQSKQAMKMHVEKVHLHPSK